MRDPNDRWLTVLEVMWDWRGDPSGKPFRYRRQAPRIFAINPRNHTGSRLYGWFGLTPGEDNVWVTNACSEVVSRASERGTPNPDWLRENLETHASRFHRGILVCGRVAQDTFDRCAKLKYYKVTSIWTGGGDYLADDGVSGGYYGDKVTSQIILGTSKEQVIRVMNEAFPGANKTQAKVIRCK